MIGLLVTDERDCPAKVCPFAMSAPDNARVRCVGRECMAWVLEREVNLPTQPSVERIVQYGYCGMVPGVLK